MRYFIPLLLLFAANISYAELAKFQRPETKEAFDQGTKTEIAQYRRLRGNRGVGRREIMV